MANGLKSQEEALRELLELWKHQEKFSEEASKSLALESSKAILTLSSAAISLAFAWMIKQPEILASELKPFIFLALLSWGGAIVSMASLFHLTSLAYGRRHKQADRNITTIRSDLDQIREIKEVDLKGGGRKARLSSKLEIPDTKFNPVIFRLNLAGILLFLAACLMSAIFACSLI